MAAPSKIVVKPLLRGHSHQAAFFVFLGACTMLLPYIRDTRSALAIIVYSLSIPGLFGISALYHRPTWTPEKRLWMKRLDHAAIYVCIAGTSTPICLLALPPNVGGSVSQLVWGAALFGIFQSLFWATAPKWVSSILYVIVGCLVVPYLAELQRVLNTQQIIFIFLGGAVYILGAITYALKRPNPAPNIFGYHEIFHLLVILGAFFHFLVIRKVIMNY